MAFSECTSLKEIHIPDGVTKIGDSAFDSCKSLSEISIPDSVTRIGKRAFCDCRSLRKIYIPDSVVQIGPGAFKSCPLLEIHCPPGSYAKQYIETNYAHRKARIKSVDIGTVFPDEGYHPHE